MKYTCFLIIIFIFFSCGISSDYYEYSDDGEINPVYREYMRTFVESISAYAKDKNSNFLIIPQNGNELVTINGEGDGSP